MRIDYANIKNNADFIDFCLGNLGDDYIRCELSDWAVNTLRDRSVMIGATDRGDIGTLLSQEIAQIWNDRLDLVGYLRCRRRPGSKFSLNRRSRRIVFAACAARRPAIMARAIPYATNPACRPGRKVA